MDNIIKRYALQNAVKYNGKADLKAVLGKVFSEIKEDKQNVIKKAKEIVEEVNQLGIEEQLFQLHNLAPGLLEIKKEKKDIFESFNIKGKIITAFPPEPSKYPHIGHAKALLLNYELAKRNNGKFILRFEDTNPELVKKEFYSIHLEDYKWLGIKPDKISYASDYIDKFYKLAEKLIRKNKAYICSCNKTKISSGRKTGKKCKHRGYSIKENLNLWQSMLKGNNLTLRLKIDLGHKNTVMRDPIIFRVIKKPHPRVKKIVWPTFDFENPVMDGIEGITYRIRSKEYELRKELHHYAQQILGFKKTNLYEVARFNLEGVESSGRVIREKIKKKKLLGWDDPRLTTLAALRRRGFLPEAIKNFVLSTGISKAESVIEWSDLEMQNRRLIDKQANRYFFIENPEKIRIANAPIDKISVPLHPDFPERGYINYKIGNEFLINENLEKDKNYRLMYLYNFRNKKFVSVGLDPILKAKLIHWLPANEKNVNVDVVMPNVQIKKGVASYDINKLNVGDICQFHRFGFCKLDRKEKDKLIFWFTHK